MKTYNDWKLTRWTKKELRAEARRLGMPGYEKMLKAELIQWIIEVWVTPDPKARSAARKSLAKMARSTVGVPGSRSRKGAAR